MAVTDTDTDTDMITVSVHVGRASDFVLQTHNKDSAVPWQNPPKKWPKHKQTKSKIGPYNFLF